MNKKYLLGLLSTLTFLAIVLVVIVSLQKKISETPASSQTLFSTEKGSYAVNVFRDKSARGPEIHRFEIVNNKSNSKDIFILSEIKKPLPVHLSELKYRLIGEDLHSRRTESALEKDAMDKRSEPFYSHMIEWIQKSDDEASWDALVDVLVEKHEELIRALNTGRSKYKPEFSSNLTVVDRELDQWVQSFKSSELKDYEFEVRGGASVYAISAEESKTTTQVAELLRDQSGVNLRVLVTTPKKVFMGKGHSVFQEVKNTEGMSLSDYYGFSVE